MANKLSVDQVRHVAKLSRLRLSNQEIEHFALQLSSVLEYMSKLNELDVDAVEPMSHALDVTNVSRSDKPAPGLPVDQALANAADKAPPFFKVPKVLGEGSGA